MASIAASFRSTCGSERRPPECSTQRSTADTPHLGQATDACCLGVRSFFFIRSDCDNTSRKAVPFSTFFGGYLTRKRVRSKCLTSILPHPPGNARLLAKSDGVADCAPTLERRCNARGVEHDRKTRMSKLRKRPKLSLASYWPIRKVSPRADWRTPLSLPELRGTLLCLFAFR